MAKKSTSKSGTRKKTVAKKKAAVKKTTAAAKKPAAAKAKKRKPTKKSILNRKFDAWIPETAFKASPDTAYENNFSAPPVIVEEEKDFKRIKTLLLKPATMDVVEGKKAKKTTAPKTPAKKKAKAPAKKKTKAQAEKKTKVPAEKKQAEPSKKKKAKEPVKAEETIKPAVSIKTLLMQRFDTWTPELSTPPATPTDKSSVYTAPPSIDTADTDLAERQMTLLLKKIDFTTPVEPFPVSVEEDTKELAPSEPETKKAQTEDAAQPEAKTVSPQNEPKKEAGSAPEPEVTPEPDATAAPETVAEPEPVVQEPEPVTEAVSEPAAPAEPEPVVQEPEAVSEPEPAPEALAGKESETISDGASPAETQDVPEQPAVSEPEAIPAGEPTVLESTEESEPIPAPLKALIACTAVIIALIVTASFMNIRHYYLVPTKMGVEIWKGNFTPSGKENVVFLPFAKAPEEIKDVYSKSEAYHVIYWYNMKEAATLTRSEKLADLEKAKTYVNNAGTYALTPEDNDRATAQLDRINSKIKKTTLSSGKK